MRKHPRRLFALLLALLFALPLLPARAEGPLQGVIYEVFVRAFADSDGDGIGDFKGILAKLDYIQALGVSALWLMPIHPSPSYHGYDVTDYRDVNPDYGTMDDFLDLLDAAHSRGIKVLLDVPLNHTSTRHYWFEQSLNEDSPYRSWYRWAKAGDPGVDVNQTVWGAKPWKPSGDAYYYAIFWDGMPDLNFDNPEVKNEVADIARFWLDMGADGFRLDATSHIYGEGEGQRLQDIAASSAFWQEFASQVKLYHPDAWLLGEAWESLDKRAQILRGMDAVVNFDVGERLLPLIKSGGSGAAFIKVLEGVYAAYERVKPGSSDAPFLSNHDQTRVALALGTDTARTAFAARVLLTLPGNPIIYYGEEIGMSGAKPDEELRTPMLWGGGDPLQASWHSSRYNGRTVPVSEQEGDPASLLRRYRQSVALRNAHPALHSGRLEAYPSENTIPLAYWMQHGKETLLVLHNPSGKEQRLKVPPGLSILYGEEDCILNGEEAVLTGLGSMILSGAEGMP